MQGKSDASISGKSPRQGAIYELAEFLFLCLGACPMETGLCAITQKIYPVDDLVTFNDIRPKIARLMRKDYPALKESDPVCVDEVNKYRCIYVRHILEADHGEIDVLDKEVLQSIREHELLSVNPEREFERQLTFGEKLSDHIASFGGSWKFIISFGAVLFVWILINCLQAEKAADPYPLILLNLVLSCIAALQAPVIMMSQNRQEEKDRFRAESDYKINLKAELEIRHLHEKMDHLLKQQGQRLFEIQQVQMELMGDLTKAARRNTAAATPTVSPTGGTENPG
jgi:uncharacterized membrane protein